MISTTRRTVLKGAGAATLTAGAAGLVLGGAALASDGTQYDPIVPLYEEWLAARAEWRSYADLPGNGNWDLPESKAAQERTYAAWDRMIGMTPTTTAGAAALVHLLWTLNGPGFAPGVDGYAEELAEDDRRLMVGVWRALTGLSGNPDDAEGLPAYYAAQGFGAEFGLTEHKEVPKAGAAA